MTLLAFGDYHPGQKRPNDRGHADLGRNLADHSGEHEPPGDLRTDLRSHKHNEEGKEDVHQVMRHTLEVC